MCRANESQAQLLVYIYIICYELYIINYKALARYISVIIFYP